MDDLHSKPKKLLNLINLCALSKHYLRNQRANLRNLREPRLFLAVMMPCRHRLFSPESARDLHSG